VNILDLTDRYLTDVLQGHDYDSYFEVCPSLFDHYFTYWADRNGFVNEISRSEIYKRRETVLRALTECEQKFETAGLPIDSLSIILFVGVGTTNGHAYYDGEQIVVWIPVETYTSNILASVFVPHEILHGLHYQQLPSFYFHNSDEKNHVGRQLITEGVATYLTAYIMEVSDSTALWADYLDTDQSNKWMNECRKRTCEISRYVIDNYHCTVSDIGIFRADDPEDILNYRVGYYVGLKIIQELVKKTQLTPSDLLRMERTELSKDCLSLLESLAL